MAKLTAKRRDALGTRKVRGLRKKNLIPGVVYGHAQENIPVALDAHDLEVALHHGERLFELDVDGQVQNVLVKDVQYDAMQQVVLHVDLARVDLDERVEVTVPLVLRGTPAGLAEGGVMHQQAAEIDLECAVRQIPEDIRVPINDMKIGDMLHMRDVKLPEGITLLSDPEAIVCALTVIEEEAPAEEGEEGQAEPEVIGEKKREEEEEEEK
ncbi:MAG: 50S ribosomal protein L25 [Planctomycetes bacterium ADurb.Bin126]|nr:MAG: 50S ribosomal protein L25 [Planctomycetes bacterium ADurb.Bin126]HOD83021.1 50S ribosomal protein L25 [Phycisphaerae bacterium]HQL71553.1 50S ribosomal protein L25 [Phycisphaerae bacterium]